MDLSYSWCLSGRTICIIKKKQDYKHRRIVLDMSGHCSMRHIFIPEFLVLTCFWMFSLSSVLNKSQFTAVAPVVTKKL